MAFRSISEVANTQIDQGKFWQQHFFKTTQPTAGAGNWADGSVGSGIPLYNAYLGAALEFAPLTGVRNTSIYTGPETGDSKYIATVQMNAQGTGALMHAVFADYLGFYPLLDLDSTDVQSFDNTAVLPRYMSGEGVCAFLIMQTPGAAVLTSATVSYTNSAGVSGRTVTVDLLSSTNIGIGVVQASNTSLAVASTPFMPLASGDTGIRSIESITLAASIGGFATLVLCKPIFNLQLLESARAAEKVFIKESPSLPEVKPGAFLQPLILRGAVAVPTPFTGFIDFIWS